MTAFDMVLAVIGMVLEYARALPETESGKALRERVRQSLATAAVELGSLSAQQEREHAEVNGSGNGNGG